MSRHSVDADTPMLMDDVSWIDLLDICTHHRACAIVPVPSIAVPSSLCLQACAIDRWCYRLRRSQWRMIMKMMMVPSSTRSELEMTSVVDEPNLFAVAISNRSHLSMAMGSSMTTRCVKCSRAWRAWLYVHKQTLDCSDEGHTHY